MGKLKDFTDSGRRVSANTSITDWSGMSSHQWQQHVITSSQTVVQENLHSLSCLEETPSISLTCYCMQQDDIFMMIMDFPI